MFEQRFCCPLCRLENVVYQNTEFKANKVIIFTCKKPTCENSYDVKMVVKLEPQLQDILETNEFCKLMLDYRGAMVDPHLKFKKVVDFLKKHRI